MCARMPNTTPHKMHGTDMFWLGCVDVLQPRAALLQRLRHRLHLQEPAGQGGGLRHALRGQVPQELRALGREVSGAECCYGAAGWDGDGEIVPRV